MRINVHISQIIDYYAPASSAGTLSDAVCLTSVGRVRRE